MLKEKASQRESEGKWNQWWKSEEIVCKVELYVF